MTRTMVAPAPRGIVTVGRKVTGVVEITSVCWLLEYNEGLDWASE
jgi:hypothetical protein